MNEIQKIKNFLNKKGYLIPGYENPVAFNYDGGVFLIFETDDSFIFRTSYRFPEKIDREKYEDICQRMNNNFVNFSISDDSTSLVELLCFDKSVVDDVLANFDDFIMEFFSLKDQFKQMYHETYEEKNADDFLREGLKMLLESQTSTTDNQAISSIIKAQELGHPYAKDAFTIAEMDRDSRQNSIVILLDAMKNVESCFSMGLAYERGDNMPQSYQDAARWYRIAAENDHTEAQCNLGWLYSTGNGVTEDIHEAKKWYTKAAENGDGIAMANLFDTYWNEANYVEAQKWAEMAWENVDSADTQQLMERMEFSHLQRRSESCDDIEEVMLAEVKLGNRVAMFNLGQYYLDNGKEQEGFSWMMKCAEFGDPGKYYVGCCYANGIGVMEDASEAFNWMEEAADNEYPNAQYVLGLFYMKGYGTEINEEYGLDLIKEAAKNGYEDAQNYLSERGIDFDDEDDNWEDDSDNEDELQDTVDVDDADTQFQIACHYMENGDYEECVEWLIKAALQNHVNAQSILGLCYYNGEGVTPDYDEAIKWFRKAANQGDSEAQLNMGLCYSKGQGVDQNDDEAFKWFSKSAEQGNGDAQSNLAACYISGLGVTPNKTLAAEWYRKAADNGSVDGQYGLGYCLIAGCGVKGNIAEGKAMLEAAARQGHGQAQALLERVKAEEEKQAKKTSGFFKKLFS